MSALEFVNNNYNGTNISSDALKGISATSSFDLDCDCVDNDCSTDGYEY